MVTEESIRVEEISAEEINKKRQPLYKRIFSAVWYTLLVVLVLISIPAIYFDIAYYPIYISGSSMAPTLVNNEFGLMDQRASALEHLKRGDIIIIDRSDNSNPDLIIKRIIALPGETIELQDSLTRDLVTITPVSGASFVLDEDYLSEDSARATVGGSYSHGPAISEPLTLSEDEYYVMGDNRMNSTDSRIETGLGPVKYLQISGKLVYIQGMGKVNNKGDFVSNNYYAPWKWRKY